MATPSETSESGNLLLPVLPLRDLCLFPEASLAVVVSAPGALRALEIAKRTGSRVLALAQRENASAPRDLHETGTVARVAEDAALPDGGHRVELDGASRARAVSVVGHDVLVAEVTLLDEGDAGDDWGSAVEALARYLHAHAELRSFLDQQRRSPEPMSWVNLACQHLPITATARQKLLESAAADRCLQDQPRPRRPAPQGAGGLTSEPAPPVARALARNTLFSAIGEGSNVLLFLLAFLAARLLGPTPFGEYSDRVRVRRPLPHPARLRHVLRVHPRHQPRPVAGPAPGRKPAGVPGRPERGHDRRSASPSARRAIPA